MRYLDERLASIWADCNEPNWDSYNGDAVTREAIEAAREYAKFLHGHFILVDDEVEVFPTPSGGTQVEFQVVGYKWEYEVPFGPDGGLDNWWKPMRFFHQENQKHLSDVIDPYTLEVAPR